MAKYDPLKDHLVRSHPRELTMTFAEIEKVLDARLPASARRPQFWANTVGHGGHVQREAWRGAHYDAFLVPGEGKVTFVAAHRSRDARSPFEPPAAPDAIPNVPVAAHLVVKLKDRWWDHPIGGSVLRVGELVGIFAGLVGLFFAWSGLREATEQSLLATIGLEEQRLTTAWQLLTSPTTSSGGREFALEALFHSNSMLRGVDLSCSAVGRIDSEGTCIAMPNLENMTLGDPWVPWTLGDSSFAASSLYENVFKNMVFGAADFSGAVLGFVRFENSALVSANFANASLSSVSFVGTSLGQINLEGTALADVDLSGAEYDNFTRINVSGAFLCTALSGKAACAVGLGQQFLDHAWFYADDPPFLGVGRSRLDALMIAPGCARPAPRDPRVVLGVSMQLVLANPTPPEGCLEQAKVPLDTVAH